MRKLIYSLSQGFAGSSSYLLASLVASFFLISQFCTLLGLQGPGKHHRWHPSVSGRGLCCTSCGSEAWGWIAGPTCKSSYTATAGTSPPLAWNLSTELELDKDSPAILWAALVWSVPIVIRAKLFCQRCLSTGSCNQTFYRVLQSNSTSLYPVSLSSEFTDIQISIQRSAIRSRFWVKRHFGHWMLKLYSRFPPSKNLSLTPQGSMQSRSWGGVGNARSARSHIGCRQTAVSAVVSATDVVVSSVATAITNLQLNSLTRTSASKPPSLASGKGGGVRRKQRSKPKCRIVKSPSSAAFLCLSHLPCTYHSDPRAWMWGTVWGFRDKYSDHPGSTLSQCPRISCASFPNC